MNSFVDKKCVCHGCGKGELAFKIDISSISYCGFEIQDKVIDLLVKELPVLLNKLYEVAKNEGCN